MRPTRACRFGALVLAALLVAPASAGAASGPASPQPPLRVTARADVSVAAAHPRRADRSARVLHVGGRARWRALLRFALPARTAVGKATLGVWALARPRGRIVVHVITSRRRWREQHLTFARAPRLGPVAGRAPSRARPCPRHGRYARACHRAGQWMWIDVTPAVGSPSRVALGLTARTRRALRLASRKDRHHAPRLLLQRASASAPAPAAAVPAPPPPAPTSAPPAPTAANPCLGIRPPAAWHHVVWIWMENKDYAQIIGVPGGPYLNAVAGRCGLATNYHAVAHPSLPNYIAATSGGTQGVTDDGAPSAHPLATPSIFQQLGSSWRALSESMPANCALTNAGRYAVRHNPAAYYTPVRAACQQQNVPLGAPAIDAAFTFVTPNLCDDMHDCSLATGDSWLQSFVPQLIATPQYQAGDTAIMITFDENDGSPTNHVATLVLAPSVVPGTQDATPYTHYSLLRTTEDLLGVPPLGAAASAPSMRAGFGLG
jgi:phosphatidylinositol-3-phosphatase